MGWHENRQRKGSPAWKAKPNRAPLRKIVDRFCDANDVARERLECGHTPCVVQDLVGPTNAVRRRCKTCEKAGIGTKCSTCGDPFFGEQGVGPSLDDGALCQRCADRLDSEAASEGTE